MKYRSLSYGTASVSWLLECAGGAYLMISFSQA